MQLDLFTKNLPELKKGKTVICPCCNSDIKWTTKYLDTRLANYLIVFYDTIKGNPKGIGQAFNPREIFKKMDLPPEEYQRAVSDFQKLGYWDFIRQTNKSGWWKITMRGAQFLKGRMAVPKKIWVYKNKVVWKDDIYLSISDLPVRWQTQESDYRLDFIQKPLIEK